MKTRTSNGTSATSAPTSSPTPTSPLSASGRPRRRSGHSCSSWLLYVLSILALILSFVVFWVALYKHQEVYLELQHVKRSLNASVSRHLDPQLASLKRVLMANERRGDRLERQMDGMRALHPDNKINLDMVKLSNERAADALRMVKEMRSSHGAIINALNARLVSVSGDKELLMAAMKSLEADLTVVESNQVELKKHVEKMVNEALVDLHLLNTNSADMNDTLEGLGAKVVGLENSRAHMEDRLLEADDARQRLENWLLRHGVAIDEFNEQLDQLFDKLTQQGDLKRSELERALRVALESLETWMASELSSLSESKDSLESELELRSKEEEMLKRQLKVLENKVNHFVRNVLSVKTLPAKFGRLRANVERALRRLDNDDDKDNDNNKNNNNNNINDSNNINDDNDINDNVDNVDVNVDVDKTTAVPTTEKATPVTVTDVLTDESD